MSKIEIRNTSNQVVSEIDAGQIDKTSTSINLFGKGTETYLKEINENFVKLLENFSSKVAPKNPQIGQLWYSKKGSNTVEVRGTGLNYNAGRYVKINNVSKSVKNKRGIALMIIDENFSSKINFLGYYDTYGSNSARTQLARKLGTVKDNEMFIMTSYDAIGSNSELNKRMEKLGTKSWHKIKRNGRYPYAAIGTGKFGIISEDLKGFDDKQHAFAQVAFESLKVEEGMGSHTQIPVPTVNFTIGEKKIYPYVESKSTKDYYSYVKGGNHPEEDTLLVVLQRNNAGKLALHAMFDKNDGKSGKSKLTISGLPKGTKMVVKDDNQEAKMLNNTTAYGDFKWYECCMDGLAVEDIEGFSKINIQISDSTIKKIKLVDAQSQVLETSENNLEIKKEIIKTEENDNLLVWTGEYWTMSAETIDGKNLKDLREFVLSGVDLSTKYNKSGGILNGSIRFRKDLIPYKDVSPTGNEIQDLGSESKRYKTVYLNEENSIYMGEGREFNKNSFVYTVEKDTDSVKKVPAGAMILNRATGESVVKLASYQASSSNNTFKKLCEDKKNGVVIGGNNFNFFGDKGIFMGSWHHGKIEQISIPTPSNSKRFGNCRAGGHSAAASDGTRGLSFWQHGHSWIQYITIASPMNAVNFGRFTGGWRGAAASNGNRAVVFGGRWHRGHSEYVLFATPMNAVKYGDLGTSVHWNAATSDGVKGIFDRGSNGWNNNQYRYVTLETPSNALHFGKMQNSRGWTGASSNGVHGLWAGGRHGSSNWNSVEKLTLATPGNSTHFGNLTYSRHSTAPVSNNSRMVATGGNAYSKTLDYLSYANGGSASKFGNAGIGLRYPASFSGN